MSEDKNISYESFLLPSNFEEMDHFIELNKLPMTVQVISAIEYAVEKKLSIIEVFRFKKSDFVITLAKESFQQNLEYLYDQYLVLEEYELCSRVKKLRSKLNSNNTVSKTIHEKT